ncbi:hypothetical protein D3C73_882240 [compost metagenome]
MRQARGQASGDQEGKQQGEQRQDAGLEQDLLLALAECIIGQADDHPAQVILGGSRWGRFAVLEKIIVQGDALQPHGGLEHFDLMRLLVAGRGLFDVHQNPVGAVLHLQEPHVGRGQCGLEQAFEDLVIARNHPVFGGRCQLVGNQLAGMVELLAQVLDPHEGEEADQQQRQQQGRAEADDLGAGTDVPAATEGHGWRSPSASSIATDASLTCSRSRERDTCALLATLKRCGYCERGHVAGGWSSSSSRVASQSP